MDDYPRTRALLTELCGLDGVDAQLPLTVIANLYRRQLRLPLLGMIPVREEWTARMRAAREAGSLMWSFGDVLAEDYRLDWSAGVEDTRVDEAMMNVDEEACGTVRAKESGAVRELLDVTIYESRQVYEPLALLYYAGHGVDFGSMLEALEIGLELVPNLQAFATTQARVAQTATSPVQAE